MSGIYECPHCHWGFMSDRILRQHIAEKHEPRAAWTSEKLKAFKVASDKAIRESADMFVFEHHEYLVSYARYLIEYLEGLGL